ncbi:MAG: YggT family protein [Alphaproteobacteria bacterium]|nr:YggT family protein [Alphaproteobacteria bacterium]
MDVVLLPLFKVLIMALNLYMDAIFVWVIMSWLTAFNIVNNSNKLVYIIQSFLDDIIKPATNKIRQYIPPVGGLDISPIFLILFIVFLQEIFGRIIFRIATAG